MPCNPSRRAALGLAAAMIVAPRLAAAAGAISAEEAAEALAAGEIALIDVRTPGEWAETGVATGAWPLDLRDPGFERRLFDAFAIAGDRPVALICATGARSGYVHAALREAGIARTLDVAEGMMGRGPGTGWIARGLPTESAAAALKAMPPALAPR